MKILGSVEICIASRTFLRMGEGMFSSFGEPGRRKSFLMVSSSARRAISIWLTCLVGSSAAAISSAARAFSAKEKGRLYSGDEVPHPLFGRQNAAMRANSSAMIKSAFVMREMVGGKQGTILEVGVVLGFCVLDRALRELLVVLWFD